MRSTLPAFLLTLSLTGAVSAVADAQLVGRNETVYTWQGTIPAGGQATARFTLRAGGRAGPAPAPITAPAAGRISPSKAV